MNKKIVDALNDIDDEYIEAAHKRFKLPKLVSWSNFGKLALCCLAIVTVINISNVLFGAKGSASYDTAAMIEEECYGEESGYSYSASSNDVLYNYAETTSDSKLIVNASMEIETANYDEVLAEISEKLNEVGGYAQSISTYTSANDNRCYSATLRIPSAKYSAFVEALNKNHTVSYYTETVDDITSTYQDLEARLTALKAQEEKVLEFYQEAKDIDDLMSIEARLSDLRYEIESIESEIKNYDVLTTYATLSINIQESISHPTNNKFINRLESSFINGWHNFIGGIEDVILFFSYHIFVIVLVVIVIIFIYLIRKIKHRHK